jgi:phosphoglycerate kinase
MAKKTVDDIQVKGKRVLVRCDFNVPMKDGKITNDKRIVAALPTIKKLIADGGKVILCSHLGKPKNGPEEKFSLAPVAVRLSELLGQEVVFANDDNVVGENAKAAVAAMKDGDVVLLQNTRFRAEETKNGEAFSKDLASLADVYVDDAFGSCHRAHCSTAGVTAYTSPNVAGYLIGKGYTMQEAMDEVKQVVEGVYSAKAALLLAAKYNVEMPIVEQVNKVLFEGRTAKEALDDLFTRARQEEVNWSK